MKILKNRSHGELKKKIEVLCTILFFLYFDAKKYGGFNFKKFAKKTRVKTCLKKIIRKKLNFTKIWVVKLFI